MSGLCSSVTFRLITRQFLTYLPLPAIAFHKFVIIFCVCLELQQNRTKQFIFYSYLTVFSLTSSLGIGLGIIITELQAGSVPGEVKIFQKIFHIEKYFIVKIFQVTASLQGVAAGTILYVVMFEVLTRERAKHVPGILQLVGVILGFGVLLLIEIFGKLPS